MGDLMKDAEGAMGNQGGGGGQGGLAGDAEKDLSGGGGGGGSSGGSGMDNEVNQGMAISYPLRSIHPSLLVLHRCCCC